MRRYALGFAFLVTIIPIARGADAPVAEADLSTAAGKAIALIQKSQAVWDKKESCASCHHELLPLTPFRLALERGVPFDVVAARGMAAKAFVALKDLDEAVQETEFIEAPYDAYVLVAAHGLSIPPSLTTATYARYLARRQFPDGSWHTMDNRPPQSHSRFTGTAAAVRAVQAYMPAAYKAEADAVVRRARDWLLQNQAATTTDRANRLLGLRWSGADDAAIQDATRQLLADQRPDGGWAQLPRMSSDAYATGETLMALHEAANVPTSHPAYQRGLRFLLSTQQADGSWKVETRLHPPAQVSPPYIDTQFPYARNQFISVMGTTWAAAALLKAVPAGAKAATLAPNVAPANPPAWAEAALAGTVTDLKKLLDGDLDPNVKTAGGTTLMMMAARDADKVQLLLERKANPNARTANGYTALMVASRCRESAAVARLLLAAGADAGPKPGEKVKYDASPLFFAASAGDLETVQLLLKAGADVKRRMAMLGKISTSPLEYAVFNDDVEMVRTLIAGGASPNDVDLKVGASALAWTALGNRPRVIPLLVAQGALVNQVDEDQMTALLYAASIDYGDTAVVDALLKAGADPAVKTKDGQTALDLARKYGHTAIAERLAQASAKKGE